MKILVTGGHGLLGTYLQNEFDGIFLNSSNYNLTSEKDVINMYKNHQPDVVVHLAAKAGGMYDNMERPFYFLEENVLMNTLVVKYAREFGVKKFIGTLSTCIYQDVSDHYPLLEEDLYQGFPHENHIGYGYAKRLMGVHIDVAKKQGLNYSYIVPSNLYGLYEHGDITRKHFLGALLDKILNANKNGDDKIIVLGDGTPLRQFTYAKDVAEIIGLIIKYDIKENLNIGTPENLSIAEMTKIVLEATNSTHLKVEWDTTKSNGQHRKDVSIEKLMNKFPNYKFTTFYNGVKEVYEQLKNK
jgi:GDP-L-fucose synthase